MGGEQRGRGGQERREGRREGEGGGRSTIASESFGFEIQPHNYIILSGLALWEKERF